MPNPNNCLRYWDLADHIRIDDAIALWCGVEPAELASLNFETQCMSTKRAALVNSATSMGRLMLNVLLSFAQFEREVTGERIRDKIAASKAKGMWMGGPLPLGYDVRDRLLVVNETEAKLVRRIFDDFVTVRSATLMAKTYGPEGVVTKGGKPFTKQTIYKMLHNRMYLGEIVHKGQSFPGQH